MSMNINDVCNELEEILKGIKDKSISLPEAGERSNVLGKITKARLG